ncbi:hypothetical protein ACQZ5N_03175 [Agrobacterium sp. 22-221-1]
MKVTNVSKGPRGLNAVAGAVLVEPGETVEVEISEVELKVSKGTGWFEFDGEAVDAGEKLDREELKKQADELGLDYAKNISDAKLQALIYAKLAE